MTISATELRRQVLANGYVPIPCHGKVPKLAGWQKVAVDEAAIKSWSRMHGADTTGGRIERTLCAIDVDSLDAQLVEALARKVDVLLPRLFVDGLIRYGRKPKEAWFLRTTEPFTRFASKKWRPADGADDGTVHQVEIFGGASPRHFGWFGPHSYHDDGTVDCTYEWDDGASPLTVPFDELPIYTPAEIMAVRDAFDEICEAAGMVAIGRSFDGGEPDRVYTITDATEFDMDDGDRIAWPEFKDTVRGARGEYVRCSGSFTGDASRVNTQNCTGVELPDGRVAVKDFMTEALHFHVDDKPAGLDDTVDKLGALLAGIAPPAAPAAAPGGPVSAPAPNWPRWPYKPGSGPEKALLHLQNEYAFVETANGGKGGILRIHPSLIAGIEQAESSLVGKYAADQFPGELGPKGGVGKPTSVVHVWRSREERVTVAGARMRPDMPRPLYHEGGDRWVNTYAPPLHPEDGSSAVFWRFLEHLLPDEEERRWFAECLAHKIQNPAVPGPGVVMVAHNVYGAGRGTLFDIVGKLFGPQYVQTIPFDMLTGRNGGARFNDWGASALVATIDEAASDEDGHSIKARVSAYETLKSIVDPAGKRPRRFEPKGRPAYTQISFTSYLVATNNADALKLPENDRRFAVLQNGEAMPPELAELVHAWMENAGNIGALYAELRDAEITVFQPFVAPPMFSAKARMIDLSKTAIERAVEEALDELPGELFTMPVVVAAAGRFISNKPTNWEGIVESVCRSKLTLVGDKQTRIMVGGWRGRVWAKSEKAARQWSQSGRQELRREAIKGAKFLGMDVTGEE